MNYPNQFPRSFSLNAAARMLLLLAVATASITMTLLLTARSAEAQLPRDLFDQFERLLDDLEPDLRKRFQTAIDDETSTVVFTLEEFKRFRDNPINPFEDLLRINPPANSGDIALNFELPSLRNRRIAAQERQSSQLLSVAQPAAESVFPSVVSFWKDDRNVALGAVVDKDGYIVTKASEVQKRAPVTCFINGQHLPVTIVRVDTEEDVALINIETTELTPVQWAPSPNATANDVQPGSFVLTPGDDQTLLAIGTYSVQPRSTEFGEQAFLGVNPERVETGVRITQVNPGEASHAAGLSDGDVITELGGQPIVGVDDLVTAIRSHRPGDSVKIRYLRSGAAQTTRAILAGRNMPSEQAAHFKMMNRLGAILSRRNDNFSFVFQHDTPLFPEQCGGPILDLNGNVIGLNIARQGRASSLAIPSSRMQTIVDDLMRSSVAARR